MADYNRRFATPPAVAYDAHRPLPPEDDLAQIFTLQQTRRTSRQLTVHYKRDLYVLDGTVATRRLRGATVEVRETEDGTVTLHAHGHRLAARLFPKDHAQLAPGWSSSTRISTGSSAGSRPSSALTSGRSNSHRVAATGS
jgi:hypothetical protein